MDLQSCPFCGNLSGQVKCFVDKEKNMTCCYVDCTLCNAKGPSVWGFEVSRNELEQDCADKWNFTIRR